jgi:signal transduction histidine kinase
MVKAKILVVEDQRIVAKDIAKRLENLGYAVVDSITSGEEAIEKVAQTTPDLVLMDIRLKGEMDGIEAAEKIRDDFDIPVIYLTAYADENTLQRAKITEPFGYIVKPFDEKDLHTAIEIALRRRLAEAAMRVALKKEKELSELKSRFWSMVAHEFRVPMTTILSSAQLLEHHQHELPEEKRRELLFLIQKAISSMNQLLDDVLDLNKVETGSLEFNPEPLDLEEFCQRIIEEIQFSTSSKHQIIFTKQNECPNACLDRKLLWHILSNLLVNAIKYSPQGGPVYLELACPNNQAIFKVKDKGIGIPPVAQEHLFEPFRRAENVGNIPGTGLGLTMVKKCLDLHDAQIDVQSTVGVGTTVTVTLPLNKQVSVKSC